MEPFHKGVTTASTCVPPLGGRSKRYCDWTGWAAKSSSSLWIKSGLGQAARTHPEIWEGSGAASALKPGGWRQVPRPAPETRHLHLERLEV